MTPEEIVTDVCAAWSITKHKLRGPSRHREIVNARREVARRLRADGLSYPAIGRYLGGRHHGTIMAYLWSSEKKLARKAQIATAEAKRLGSSSIWRSA